MQVLQWQILGMTRPIYKIWIVHFASIAPLLSLQWTPIQNLNNVLFYSPLVYTLGLKYWYIFVTVKISKVGTTFFQNQQSPKKS